MITYITLFKNEETVSDNEEISETLNNFFSEVVTNLPQYDGPTVNVEDIEDPVARAVENIRTIQVSKRIYRNTNNTFHFEKISAKEIEKELKNLLSSKAAQDSDMPTKAIKDNIDIFASILLEEFNK